MPSKSRKERPRSTGEREIPDQVLSQDSFGACMYMYTLYRPFYSCRLSDLALNGSEAGVDVVLIQTSLLLLCKSSCSYAN